MGEYLDNLIDNTLYKYPLKRYPIIPFVMLADTNRGLEDYYKRHNIADKEIKNTMRHITGAGQMQKAYGESITRTAGIIKESYDHIKNNKDHNIDFYNNNLGINYAKENQKFTREKLMDYAYEQAKKNKGAVYKGYSLYDLMTGNID